MYSPRRPKLLLLIAAPILAARAQAGNLSGRLSDPQGRPVAAATLRLTTNRGVSAQERITDAAGRFLFSPLPNGAYRLSASAQGFEPITSAVRIRADQTVTLDLHFTQLSTRNESVTVSADVKTLDVQNPDPAQQVLIREEILDANPGRPGAPVSLPGLPMETASGGIKAPQYFSPGVAGDHGEPIAQFIRVGTFLLPNNLSANAHGNGYSDPNIMVPSIIESVITDGGAFNAREGNHSVNLAATYLLRPEIEPFLTVTGDQRDADLVFGWRWLALEVSAGNGFLDRLEHRQQYKLNTVKTLDLGSHKLSVLGIGYYGVSKIPGLVPLGIPNLHDTIDPRQRDQTHTGELAANDVWTLTPQTSLQLSSFFRSYNLALYSNFGDGLIRQSEFRTEAGGNSTYLHTFNSYITLMTGLDYVREAPRRDDLDRYVSTDPAIYGPFEKVTANNITLDFLSPFVALDGNLTRWLHYSVAWRRDQIGFNNQDLLDPNNSFHTWVPVNSPKATLAAIAPDRSWLPSISYSWGQAFFTNDPRMGTGLERGTAVSRAHAEQLVVSKTIYGTDVRVTLARVTQEASLAKIDADTGLEEDEGPGRNLYISLAARRRFRRSMLQASFSKADARDLSNGTPTAEAPRTIFDALGTTDSLPWRLQARAEFESVGAKPLGDGFLAVPVKEFRGALVRTFRDGKLQAGVHFQIASGYTGQTLETFALPTEGEAFERVVGVYIPSYATVSFSYRFGR